MSQAQISVGVQYPITKDGKVIAILTESEMKQFLSQPQIVKLIEQMHVSLDNVSHRLLEEVSTQMIESKAAFGMVEDFIVMPEAAAVAFPNGFQEKARLTSDPKAARKAVFVYAYNPLSQEYGFRIVSVNGEISQFHRAGSVHDPTSIIGSFLRGIPKTDKPLIKRDFLKLGLECVTEGRRLKALIDIAEMEGYLSKVVLPERKGRTGYLRTGKLEEFGGGA